MLLDSIKKENKKQTKSKNLISFPRLNHYVLLHHELIGELAEQIDLIELTSTSESNVRKLFMRFLLS